MKAVRICMQNIRKWGGNRRILMCIAMTTLLVYSYTKDLSVLCNYMGQKMNPWIFPFLFAFRYMRIVFMIPVVFIFCDAPFVDTNQTYVMLRTKRNIWSMGQILYIIVSSFLYTLFHLLLTIIFNIQYMQWGTTWGDVLGNAGTSGIMVNLNIRYTTVGISASIIRYFTPAQAMFFSFILMWLSFIFIGMLIYAINILTKSKGISIIVTGFLILLNAVVEGKPYWCKFSPLSWNYIGCIDVGGRTQYPTITYVLCMYILMIVIFGIIAVAAGNKREVVVYNEQ